MSVEAMKLALKALELTANKFQKQRDAIEILTKAINEASENGLYREGYRNGWAFGEASEREACANLCQDYSRKFGEVADLLAGKIRERNK